MPSNGRLTEFPTIYDGSGRPFDLAALRADRNARQMNDGDGRWMDGTSGTDERYDGMDMPHPFTFAALYRGASHTYLHQWDEAMKHNRINALAMRRDCWLMSLLYERVDDTLSKRWHLEVDNPRDPWQKSVADGITKILKCTPHLKRMFRYMLHGSLWYGRYGANLKWVWDEMYVPVMQRSGPIEPGTVSEPQFAKQRVLRIQKHKPINGDKISFHHDDTPYVMLNAGWSDHLRGRPDIIYPTGAGATALLLRGTWREQVFIAESDPDDSDFFEAEMAAGVHGVGIRSRIYWLDFMRRDYISWVTDSMERLGLGLVVIWYDNSNADAKKEAFAVAKTYSRRAAICMPRSPDSSWQGGGIEVVEAPTNGAQIVLELQRHIEEQIERYIIGQTMSSGADNDSGLGGTGRSEFAADTKRKRCMFDADDFASSMTGSDVEPAPISTIKKWVYPFCDFPVWMVFDHEHDDPSKKMEAIKTCVDMGVSFPENRIRELTGIPAPEEGDEIIGGKQALALEQAANMATGGVIGGGGEQGGLESGAPDESGKEGASNDAFEGNSVNNAADANSSVKYATDSSESVDEQLWEKCRVLPYESGKTGEIGWVDKWRIVMVDGNDVKIKHDPDFVEGNNYKESPEFIPENEIWLDNAITPPQLPYICYHECHECRDMEGGMSYSEAHNRANVGEMILRKRGPENYALDLKGDHDQQFLQLSLLINRIRNQGVGRELLPKLKDFLRRYPDMARRLSASDLAFVNTRE